MTVYEIKILRVVRNVRTRVEFSVGVKDSTEVKEMFVTLHVNVEEDEIMEKVKDYVRRNVGIMFKKDLIGKVEHLEIEDEEEEEDEVKI